MADLALGGLERIIKACLAIKKAVETVQQNKKECRDIQRCVASVTPLMSWLKELTMGAVMHPSFTGPLDDLAGSMDEALQLITDCQQKNALRHLLGAGDMAKQLRRVQDDIQRKLVTVIFATSILQVQISVSVTNTLHYVGAHPPFLLPQDAGRLSSNMTHSTTDNVRSGSSMLTRGGEVPYPSISRTESRFFELEDTAHHFLGENIAGGSHYIVRKLKIVIKLGVPNAKNSAKAMQLTSIADGVSSMGITGDGMDRLEVVGEQIDVAYLMTALRKKICRADILQAEEVKENKLPLSISPVVNRHSDHLTNDVARSGTNRELTMVARGNGVPRASSSRLPDFNFSELEATTHYFSEENISVGGGPSLLEKILTPRATDEAGQRFNSPFSGSSSDSEELPSSSPHPASFKGKGKQTLSVAQPHHQEVRPHVAAPARPDDGPSPRGIMAHLRAAAAGVKACRLRVDEWLVPVVPAYGIIFVFVFLLFLRIVTSRNFYVAAP